MMEYPFKDLLPIDEVLEREGYYKDWTHLDPEVFYSLTQISEYIKTKGYGVDVRLLISQLAEHFGLKTTQVVDLANSLSTKHDDLKDQFDVIIRDATSGDDWGGEIVLARGDKPTLGDRLDDTTAQLAQAELELMRTTQPLKFGELKMPDNFVPTLPFKLFRGGDGIVRHNFDFETLKTGRQIYVDKVNGTDLETSGGKSAPFKTILYAINLMIATDWTDFTIRILGDNAIFYRSEWLSAVGNVFENHQISIVHDSDKEFYLTMGEPGLTWTKDGTVYTTTRTNTYALYDLINKDAIGAPSPIPYVTTVSECRTTPNSWTTASGVVYYNKIGVAPTEVNTLVGVSATDAEITLLNSRLFIENATILGSRRSNYGNLQPAVLRLIGDISGNTLTGKYFDHKCKYIGGDFVTEGELTGNGLETIDLKESYSFNSVGAYVNRDGFNHHYSYIKRNNPSRVRECIGFQYQCAGYLNGTRDTNSNNNAFTSHEGATVLRVGCVGFETRGPVLADVGGCLSINIDCHMRDSLLPNRDTYQFEDYASGNGETYLINCSGSGDFRYSLWTDLPVYLNNFRGRTIYGANKVEYVE